MKESTKELVTTLYKAGFTNIDIFTNNGVVHAKDMFTNQEADINQKNKIKYLKNRKKNKRGK